ncbi:MAG TPA: AAA family ATPase [Kineosporiaceae bacterium]|nr:AAA family ATPase [Kineosporiaceae bacterium]
MTSAQFTGAGITIQVGASAARPAEQFHPNLTSVPSADQVLAGLVDGAGGRPVLVATRGLPGCGKTRWAQTWQIRLTGHGLTVSRISRDDVRAALGLNPATTTPQQEVEVTLEHHARIRAALTGGSDVVLVDDTHLQEDHLAATLAVARACGAQVAVADLRHVPLDVCIRRDATRTGRAHVGAERIRTLAAAGQPRVVTS